MCVRIALGVNNNKQPTNQSGITTSKLVSHSRYASTLLGTQGFILAASQPLILRATQWVGRKEADPHMAFKASAWT